MSAARSASSARVSRSTVTAGLRCGSSRGMPDNGHGAPPRRTRPPKRRARSPASDNARARFAAQTLDQLDRAKVVRTAGEGQDLDERSAPTGAASWRSSALTPLFHQLLLAPRALADSRRHGTLVGAPRTISNT